MVIFLVIIFHCFLFAVNFFSLIPVVSLTCKNKLFSTHNFFITHQSKLKLLKTLNCLIETNFDHYVLQPNLSVVVAAGTVFPSFGVLLFN